MLKNVNQLYLMFNNMQNLIKYQPVQLNFILIINVFARNDTESNNSYAFDHYEILFCNLMSDFKPLTILL